MIGRIIDFSQSEITINSLIELINLGFSIRIQEKFKGESINCFAELINSNGMLIASDFTSIFDIIEKNGLIQFQLKPIQGPIEYKRSTDNLYLLRVRFQGKNALGKKYLFEESICYKLVASKAE